MTASTFQIAGPAVVGVTGIRTRMDPPDGTAPAMRAPPIFLPGFCDPSYARAGATVKPEPGKIEFPPEPEN